MTESAETAPPGDSMRRAFLWTLPLIGFCLLAEYVLFAPSLPTSLRWLAEVRSPIFAHLVISALLIVPLIWRYDHPREVFATVSGIALLQFVSGAGTLPADLAVLVAMFAVCRLCSFRWALAAGAVAEIGVMLVSIAWGVPARVFDGVLGVSFGVSFPGPDIRSLLHPATLAVMFGVAAIWIAGVYAHSSQRSKEWQAEREVHVERERGQQQTITLASERQRIARELHDVIAHNVSVIVVHAEGGRLALDGGDDGTAHQAFDTIWSTGRTTLAEMRRLLGVLREGAEDAGQGYAPQPGIDQLGDLIEQVRSSGHEVTFTINGVPPALSPGLQLTLYRVVQESLTNVMKHAGPDAATWVVLSYEKNSIEVEIEDDGRGAAARADGGHGLVGMRERVAAGGGTMIAGPRPGGGFRVRVRIPSSSLPSPVDEGARA